MGLLKQAATDASIVSFTILDVHGECDLNCRKSVNGLQAMGASAESIGFNAPSSSGRFTTPLLSKASPVRAIPTTTVRPAYPSPSAAVEAVAVREPVLPG